MSKPTLGLAVIGCGAISSGHLKGAATHPKARLAAVVDVNEEAARKAQDEYGAAKRYASWEDAVADPDVDAVDICLPHSLHETVAVAAASAGKHVLVEKPMALDLASADRMLEACEARGLTLMVAQVLRFWEPHLKVREILRSGRIGRPRHLLRRRVGWSKKIGRDWYRHEKEGSMVLFGFASHEVDILLWWTEEKPARVYAQGLTNNEYWNQDELSVLVTTEHGTLLSLSHSLNCRDRHWDQIVVGSEDSLYVQGNEIRVGEDEPITVERKAGTVEEVHEFVDAVTEGRLPEADGRDVRKTMVVLDACVRSMASGKAIDVSEA